jgi:hypothetical protein
MNAGRILFGGTTNLANHDDGISVSVRCKQLERINERCADQRIAADADARRLTHTDPRQLVNGFIGQRAALRDNPDAPFLTDVTGMMPPSPARP